MKTDWDYTALADAYLKRPDYSSAAVAALLARAGTNGEAVCDIGAGTGNLTRLLAESERAVVAVEPNAAMRRIGMARTEMLRTVRWVEATGEATGQADGVFDLVTFGSSFNVCDRPRALRESARILRPRGWLACLWNHRCLDDPLQRRIEAIIGDHVPAFAHGARRDDQRPVIAASGRFDPAERIEAAFTHVQSIADCVEAWRSHATLARQAGDRFPEIVGLIERTLRMHASEPLRIPYTTVITMARLARDCG